MSRTLSTFSFPILHRTMARQLYLSSFIVISLLISSANLEMSEAFVAEATEVIGVVRLGVSLVEYIYKVFDNIFEDSELSDVDITGQRGRELDREVLRQYEVISRALERMEQDSEDAVKAFIARRTRPSVRLISLRKEIERWRRMGQLLGLMPASLQEQDRKSCR